MFANKKKKFIANISPDEIFLDAQNIPNFDSCQLEGRIEKPIGQKIFFAAGIFFSLLFALLFLRAGQLQIARGEDLALRADDNHLQRVMLPAERGLIYDRNGEVLAWNGTDSRNYLRLEGLAHVVGYTGLLYEEIVGKAGVEKSYDEALAGEAGIKLVETSSKNEIISESAQIKPKSGESVYLTIDAGVQNKLYEILKNLSAERGFQGGAAVVLDVNNGEVLSLVSYPEYNSHVLTDGEPKEKIDEYFADSGKPFVNRAVSGLYAPGSVIKPFVALAALNEKIIDPFKEIFSSGSISIPNPYFPDLKSVFYDWKAHGWVDMRHALAVSSNVYFYTIGGGYEDVNGLGIGKIGEYMRLFGLGEQTNIQLAGEKRGLVPSPQYKKDNSEDPVWRIGDTYNISVGQGDFQVTPLQMAVATALLANNGYRVSPVLVLNKAGLPAGQAGKKERIEKEIPVDYFQIVREGMRRAVENGTAQGLRGLPVKVAAKTGTAELGSGIFVNSWLIAFWPYENPRFSISIVLERGRASNLIGGVYAGRELLDWMSIHKPNYLTP